MNHIQNLHDLLCHEVQVLYSAEQLIMRGLPRMIQKAQSPELQRAFEKHLNETERQCERLKEAARLLDIAPDGRISTGIEGIMAEAEKLMHADASPEALDAALIGDAQKIEHYEIAGYGTAAYMAHELGLTQVAHILEGTLEEEKSTNSALSYIAKNLINVKAE
ncbi:ferritin-like domain-containing protein [Hymenobacter koreensis]|uniref:Ferritin-like domain-containing protein n=1 Tax=Hymenobacter koreensis TaxID=1084523 RepID=A0ABP8JPD8_9BACT